MRTRWVYVLAVGVTVGLGLASRAFASALPWFVARYAGDTLWALMVFLGVGLLAPRWPTHRVALAALAFAYAIEVSQLYHAPWIDALRATRLGGLVLGFGFLWRDLVCYAVGVALGMGLDRVLKRKPATEPT